MVGAPKRKRPAWRGGPRSVKCEVSYESRRRAVVSADCMIDSEVVAIC